MNHSYYKFSKGNDSSTKEFSLILLLGNEVVVRKKGLGRLAYYTERFDITRMNNFEKQSYLPWKLIQSPSGDWIHLQGR